MVADTTYVSTAAGFLYPRVVLDAFSRRIVGWAMAGHLRQELVSGLLATVVFDFIEGWYNLQR